jgi:hypothetical protein
VLLAPLSVLLLLPEYTSFYAGSHLIKMIPKDCKVNFFIFILVLAIVEILWLQTLKFFAAEALVS